MREYFISSDEEKVSGCYSRQKDPTSRKWLLLPCLLLVVGTTLVFSGFGTTITQRSWESIKQSQIITSLKHLVGLEYIPLSQDTVYHSVSISERSRRWKRSASGTSGDSSGSGDTTTVDMTTAMTEAITVTEASAEKATTSNDGSAEETTTSNEGSAEETTTSNEGSAEETTAVESTTESMFEQSGENTTETSGDETTTMLDTTAGISGTTQSLFDMSGDATTESSGETTTTEEATTAGDSTTIEMSGDNTTEASGDTTTTFEMTTNATDNTTTFDVTTAAVPPEEASEEAAGIPLMIAIILLIVGIIVGILLVLAVQALLKKYKARNSVTPVHSRSNSAALLDPSQPPELNWLMEREDSLLRAMALGQIGVLEFALSESRSAGLSQENPSLMRDAERKLNKWKRTHKQLEMSYREKDLSSMDEFMERFNECEMKDESGIYQRCVDLKWDIKHTELNLGSAANTRDEAMLMAAIGQYEALRLQPTTMETSEPYKEAKRVMEELRQEKLLEGRSWEVVRSDLRAAVLAREPVAITAALAAFVKAEVPDTYNDADNAKRTLEMIEAERADSLRMAQKKLEEASISRDQVALKEAIDECRKCGSPNEELKESEKLLRVVETEDKLLGELRQLSDEGDITKLSNAIVVFKTPSLGMVDKTGDLKNAEEVLDDLKQKQRMHKTKEDVTWRLQNAMAVGDIVAMESMIKALQALAASGEVIDEALLLRAMSELEANRGQVDYRKRMEAIKNALARTIAAENSSQTQDLIDQMSLLAEDEKYTMTADDSRVLDDARTSLNSMKDKKVVVDEIARVKPDLTLSLIPPHLVPLQNAVQRMSVAKVQAEPFPGVFSEEDDVLLHEAKVNVNVLDNKVTNMQEARQQLDWAVENRDYTQLKHSIRNAITAPFIERSELVEPRKLAVFLDPKARRMAVKRAIRARDIRGIEIALHDLQDAKVNDPELVAKGERTVDKLKKREKRRAKEERRKEREDAERAAEIAHLTGVLEQAIASRDTEHLQLALEEFEESGYDTDDVPKSAEAEELFDNLKIQDIRERLLDSINRRDVDGLEKAIDDADFGGYVMDVEGEYHIAKDLLYHLRELNRLREAISDMNRSLISEIHKYPTPPAAVHKVMTAVFILLGESPSKMKNWSEVQGLLGKLGQNAITRRVKHCVPGDIPTRAVMKAEQQMSGLKLDELSEISRGAATFFAWTTCMIKEHAQVDAEQRAFADLEPLPDIPGLSDRPVTRPGGYGWLESNK